MASGALAVQRHDGVQVAADGGAVHAQVGGDQRLHPRLSAPAGQELQHLPLPQPGVEAAHGIVPGPAAVTLAHSLPGDAPTPYGV
jgi:hypothetical protein